MTRFDFPRITRDPRVMQGEACIRDMRVTVGMILGNLGAGVTVERLLEGYPYLEREDVSEALRYGAWLASERENQLDPAAIRARHFGPTIVQLRTPETLPADVGPAVRDALEKVGSGLLSGAVLTIEPGRTRHRPPPSKDRLNG